METSQRWYRLSMAKPPWGDYGDILISGMTAHADRTGDGLLRLERTGPFVPPVTVAGFGDLLVTDEFRAELDRSPLAGLEYRPVEKAHIVRLRWEDWDLTAEDPPWYPESGEPEDYVLARPHDPDLAAQLGPIWEVVLPDADGPADADLVRDPSGFPPIAASQRARDWLEEHAGRWLSFDGPAGD